ncbi:MAG TPA: hypothetical protein V6C91_09935 [Coleofasciculaceae cyanobacterium]
MQKSKPIDSSATQASSREVPWWSKLIAIATVINLVLVLFDLSYIPLRDFYFQQFPSVVVIVDPLKGIEPHPFTQRYLRTVDELEQQVPQVGLHSPVTEQLLADLRQKSAAMINENPFMVALKFGTFAKIQRQMRQHIGTDSAKQAFEQFWNDDFLTARNWQEELQFFDRQIRPLMQTNYFRLVDDYGQYVDKFWQLDGLFVSFFALEFLVRTFFISYRRPGVSWLDAMLRRWYDMIFFLPFWRWLRIVPVTVRLHQTGIVKLDRVLSQVTHEPAAYLSEKVSQFVMVGIIEQAQDSLKTGEVTRSLLYPKPYKTVNDINELEVVTDRLLKLTIYKVLPQVQPNLEALVHYSIEGAFKKTDFYRTLHNIPGLWNLPEGVIEPLANSLAHACVEVLASAYSDEQGRKIFDRLTADFSRVLRLELQNEQTLQELQFVLSDLLEEVKLNYIIKAKDRDPEAMMEEVEQIVQAAEHPSVVNK